MDKIITFNKYKDKTFNFELVIDGLQIVRDQMIVRLVIKDSGILYGFDCTHVTDNEYTVTLPAMDHLRTAMYPFDIEVVVDGYYFTPFNGSVDVVSKVDVSMKSQIPTEIPESLTPTDIVSDKKAEKSGKRRRPAKRTKLSEALSSKTKKVSAEEIAANDKKVKELLESLNK